MNGVIKQLRAAFCLALAALALACYFGGAFFACEPAVTKPADSGSFQPAHTSPGFDAAPVQP
jgi:hypothetical protein